jgi:hypothetical protein
MSVVPSISELGIKYGDLEDLQDSSASVRFRQIVGSYNPFDLFDEVHEGDEATRLATLFTAKGKMSGLHQAVERHLGGSKQKSELLQMQIAILRKKAMTFDQVVIGGMTDQTMSILGT